jgi:hypothetical protein
MADTVHTSHIKIVQDAPPLRRAFIEDFEEPFYYSIHGGIAEFYGRPPKGDHPATLDQGLNSRYDRRGVRMGLTKPYRDHPTCHNPKIPNPPAITVGGFGLQVQLKGNAVN